MCVYVCIDGERTGGLFSASLAKDQCCKLVVRPCPRFRARPDKNTKSPKGPRALKRRHLDKESLAYTRIHTNISETFRILLIGSSTHGPFGRATDCPLEGTVSSFKWPTGVCAGVDVTPTFPAKSHINSACSYITL